MYPLSCGVTPLGIDFLKMRSFPKFRWLKATKTTWSACWNTTSTQCSTSGAPSSSSRMLPTSCVRLIGLGSLTWTASGHTPSPMSSDCCWVRFSAVEAQQQCCCVTQYPIYFCSKSDNEFFQVSFSFCLSFLFYNWYIKFSQCIDSNRGPQVLEATSLPTEPQSLAKSDNEFTTTKNSTPCAQNLLRFQEMLMFQTFC